MTDSTIFEGDPATPAPVVPQAPQVPDHLKDLVGEGKKYASVEDALKSIPHAQAHIQRIEDENKRIRDELARAAAAEETYKKLMDSMNQDPPATPAAPMGMDEASVADLLERKLAEREMMKEQTANVTRVKDALVGKYGDKAQEVYEAKAKELGVGVSFLNDIVRRSPKAAEELFGIKAAPSGGTIPPGSVNTAALPARPHDPKPVRGPLSGGDLMEAWRRAKPQE